jgi:hypothetical protein
MARRFTKAAEAVRAIASASAATQSSHPRVMRCPRRRRVQTSAISASGFLVQPPTAAMRGGCGGFATCPRQSRHVLLTRHLRRRLRESGTGAGPTRRPALRPRGDAVIWNGRNESRRQRRAGTGGISVQQQPTASWSRSVSPPARGDRRGDCRREGRDGVPPGARDVPPPSPASRSSSPKSPAWCASPGSATRRSRVPEMHDADRGLVTAADRIGNV